ncbi:iron transporter [Opitutaceae bacterium EW11]|nr:iron transporter [Opitutaceae bacterium EW11]
MFTSFLLALREGTEAALVVGLVLATLRRLDRGDCDRLVWLGVGSATAASLAAALLLQLVGWQLTGTAEPVFEGVTLLLAATLLTWMVLWSRRESDGRGRTLESGLRLAACAPARTGVFLITFVAVSREGLELALFLTASSFGATPGATLLGTALGLGTAVLIGWLLFAGAARLQIRRFFRVTSVLLIFFSAGLVAKGVHELNEAGWIPPLAEPLWNTSAVLDDRSALGEVLRTLFGYRSHPSLTSVLGYLAYFAVVALLLRGRHPRSSDTPCLMDRETSPGGGGRNPFGT